MIFKYHYKKYLYNFITYQLKNIKLSYHLLSKLVNSI